MSDVPQPPESSSDIRVPMPDQGNLKSHRASNLIGGIGLIAFVLCIFLMHPPFIWGQRTAADRTETINHAREIGLALQEFDSDYGRFPDASTANAVALKTPTLLSLGDSSSNQLFRQLIVSSLKSERPFFAKTAFSKRPDDLFEDDAHALAPGECGFAYVAGLLSSGDPGTPILFSPMIPGTRTFDPKPFGGKAVVLYLDNEVRIWSIEKDGHVRVNNGLDLFDPAQSYWHGKAPDLKWQE